MTSNWPISRPTENAALNAAARSARPLPDYPVLFAGLVTAYALRDRRGLNLFAHAITRRGGEVGA